MSSLGSPSTFFLAKKKAYEVERSLRFNDDDSAYLSRTPSSAGNRRTYTISVWAKIIDNGTYRAIIGAGGGTSRDRLQIFNDDKLVFNLNDGSGGDLRTTQLLRDPSAWYHIVVGVDTTQSTASDRIKLYLNGSQVTSFSTENYPSQNYDCKLNNNIETFIGQSSSNNFYFDGYLAEFNFIDGSQLTPSSFAETDVLTGEYKPKKYTGSYGTNGFYLNFSDNSGTTATTLGKDSSGNGNNFTPNNFVTGDAVKDSPTNNFCTLNAIQGVYSATGTNTYSEGNLKVVTPNSGTGNVFGNMSFTSGKWYAEAYVSAYSSLERFIVGASGGVIDTIRAAQNIGGNAGAIDVGYFGQTGVKNISGSSSSYGDTYTVGDIIGVALDLDNRTVNFYKNNSAQGTISIASTGDWAIGTGDTSGGGGSTMIMNYGQDSSFAGAKTAQGNADGNGKGDFYYSPPSGFVAMCSANLPDPTIKLPNKHFEVRTYTGTGAGNTQTLTGFEFAPDLVWGKNRTSAYNPGIFDTVRGATNRLWPNLTNAEASNNAITAFTSDGYTVGTDAFNTNSQVTWNWKAGGSSTSSNSDGSITSSVSVNVSAGFSIVTFSGSGNRTIGHGLGVAPQVIIMKGRNVTDQWTVGHQGLDASNPWHKGIPLNTSASTQDNSGFWNDTAPTSTVFSKGTWNDGYNMVAYCFSEVKNYSKFGSYRGNQNTKGSFIYTGFEPALVITKGTWGGNWNMYDNKRNPYNVANKTLYPNLSNAESTENSSGNQMDLLSNGFKLRGSNNDTNHAADFIYLAFAESPFKYARAR